MNEIFIVEGERSNYNGTTRKVLGVYSSLERAHKTIQEYFVSTLDNIDEAQYQNYVVAERFLNDALTRPSQTIVKNMKKEKYWQWARARWEAWLNDHKNLPRRA